MRAVAGSTQPAMLDPARAHLVELPPRETHKKLVEYCLVGIAHICIHKLRENNVNTSST